MMQFIETASSRDDADAILAIVRLGLEHEMQHQELLVYDIKHLLCDQYDAPIKPAPKFSAKLEGMAEIAGGLFMLGYDSLGYGSQDQSPKSKVQGLSNYDFAFDNE